MISNINKNKMEGLSATLRHRGYKNGTLTTDTEYPHTTKHALPTIVIYTKIKKKVSLSTTYKIVKIVVLTFL